MLIELELNIFGKSGLHLVLFILFLLSLRVLGKYVIVVMHEVITDIDELAEHINVQKGSVKSTVMNFFLRNFYRALFTASHIIVFEKVLKERLLSLCNNKKKISVIPIAVEVFPSNVSKHEARKELNIPDNAFVVLAFGFLAWYKGTDWLANVWPENGEKKHLKLILAGGTNPNRKELPYYQKYLGNLTRVCQEKNILLTGFIPEGKMPLYFTAADLLVFPYRAQMSSSATISQGFSFEKPILVSQPMHQIFTTHDMREALTETDLYEKDILFELDETFLTRVEELQKNPGELKKLSLFSKKMKEARSWGKIGHMYYETLFGK